jgi:hypothetical protein
VHLLDRKGSLNVNTAMVHNPQMPRTKVNDYPQMKIRLSPDLKARIDEAAKANNRTLNAEITARLEITFAEGSPSCCFSESRMRELMQEELRKAGVVPEPVLPVTEHEPGFSIPMQRRKY